MLETDCMIPTNPVPIPIPDHITLYGIARSVRALQLEGVGKWGIIKKLHISEEAYNDAIFEINRAKAVDEMNGIAPKKRKRRKIMIENLKEKVMELKEQGMKNSDIAKELGITPARVSQIVKELGIAPAKINAEFDAAVDQMIAESKAADTSDTNQDTLDTKKDTSTVPDAVMQAVADKIETLSAILSDNLITIKKMQQDNEQIRSELAGTLRMEGRA